MKLFRFFRATLAVAVVCITLPAAAQSCRTSTAFLDNRLPQWSDPSLKEMRRKAVSEDIVLAMRNAKQQGFSPESAVDVTLKQAKDYDVQIRKALGGAMDVDALGTTDDQFLERLQNGTLSVNRCDEGIRSANLCIAIVNKMAAVVMRAVAAEMQCHIRAGNWGR
jgi:hypothetical protein